MNRVSGHNPTLVRLWRARVIFAIGFLIMWQMLWHFDVQSGHLTVVIREQPADDGCVLEELTYNPVDRLSSFSEVVAKIKDVVDAYGDKVTDLFVETVD